MGGIKSRYKGFINYDKVAENGIQDYVQNFNNHFAKNTIKEMIVDNPRDNFLELVDNAIQNGGTITIRGGMSNRNFSSLYKKTEIKGYEILSKKENVPNPGFKQSDGKTPVTSQINEIVLKKKGG